MDILADYPCDVFWSFIWAYKRYILGISTEYRSALIKSQYVVFNMNNHIYKYVMKTNLINTRPINLAILYTFHVVRTNWTLMDHSQGRFIA